MENTTKNWILELDDEDLEFIRRFILVSGSLKDMSTLYQVTYPTIRTRLDKLIEKIRDNGKSADDPYISLIKAMTLEGKIDFGTARLLIQEYKHTRE
ncbi:MAG: DUF2089 family protein [Ruminococcus sp.]|nr:DUF2089 family protein [Ruminococcus sp.]